MSVKLKKQKKCTVAISLKWFIIYKFCVLLIQISHALKDYPFNMITLSNVLSTQRLSTLTTLLTIVLQVYHSAVFTDGEKLHIYFIFKMCT